VVITPGETAQSCSPASTLIPADMLIRH
jgi:hypothetical protein